jgi:hypothetical protein
MTGLPACNGEVGFADRATLMPMGKPRLILQY